ncbi:hypothetical protein [Methanocaldococcus infernus]
MKSLENGRLRKLYYTIYILTEGDKRKWVRQEVLIAILYYLTNKGIFNYLFSPSPYYWLDRIKFINYSYEIFDDLNILVNNEIVNELLVSVRGHGEFIIGYSINKILDDVINDKELEVIKNLLLDENGKLKKIKLESDGLILGDEKIEITKLKKIDYSTKPYRLKVSLWITKI